MVRVLADLLPDEARLSLALPARAPGTARIVCLGDSYTYGLGVAAEESLPSQLEQALGREDIEVLNWGRPGLNLVHEWALARQLLGAVEVDLVVWLVSNDDAHPWRRDELAARGDGWQESWANQWDPRLADLELVRRVLVEIEADARAVGARVCVVYYQASSESELPRQVLRLVAEHAGLPFLNLLPALDGLEREVVQISAADCHPTPLAHRLAARALAEGLRPYLPPPRSPTDDDRARRRAQAEDAERACGAPLALAARADRSDTRGRQRWNRTYRRSYQRVLLEDEVLELGRLGEVLRGVDRELLVSSAGHGHTAEPVPAAAALQRLAELAAVGVGALDALERELEAEPAGAAHSREVVALAGAVRARLSGVIALAERHRGTQALLGAGPASAWASAEQQLGRLVASMERATAPTSRAPCVRVYARFPVDVRERPLNVTLVVTLSLLQPLRKRVVELYYLVLDGRTHIYTVRLPPGTIGRVYVEVRSFSSWAGQAAPDHGELVERMTLDQQPYAPGQLYLAPLAEDV